MINGFRVWGVKENEYVYDFVLNQDGDLQRMWEDPNYPSSELRYTDTNFYKAEPSTGQPDKNGKIVHAGDYYCRYMKGLGMATCEVTYRKQCGWGVNVSTNGVSDGFYEMRIYDFKGEEIIGTIHDADGEAKG